ncbi:MAG TPA: T9SS type A sorting domain-containing protein, partial [Prolixibacteraceae bacterium]
DTSLTTLTIPQSVSSIGPSAFYDCRNLESIYSYPVQPVDISNTDGGGVFFNVDTTSCTLYIPAGTKELYDRAFGWKDFKNREEITVGVNEISQSITRLDCYPNPFVQAIFIEIQNPRQVKITVDIYNMAGQMVKNLVLGNRNERLHLMWNGTNERNEKVPPGVYICRMNGQSKQLMLMKP